MKILLVAATQAEVAPLGIPVGADTPVSSFTVNDHTVDILITGVGMVATAFAMGKHLAQNQYNLAINAGIAGSFDFDLSIGEVVNISEDVFTEQGAEDGDHFLSLKDLGFGDIIYQASNLHQPDQPLTFNLLNTEILNNLKTVKAITVNRVHGNELSISKTLARFKAQTESMEGASFLYACKQFQLPCLQIRAISNYVERRNREKWNIGMAIKNLNQTLSAILEKNN